MDKLVIVINGKGGVGKDTLCEIVGEYYKTINVSAITPIKKIAYEYGWQGEKDNKSRRFLSELKRVFADYNDLPNQYLLKEYRNFLISDKQIMFVHIREKDQIEKFVYAVENNCITLLITRNISLDNKYGNYSDDYVDEYKYDYYFDNNLALEQIEDEFLKFFKSIIAEKNLNIYPFA